MKTHLVIFTINNSDGDPKEIKYVHVQGEFETAYRYITEEYLGHFITLISITREK